MNAKKVALAIALAMLFIGYPQQSAAKEFTSSELLGLANDKQESYFQVSITMAAFIAAQNNADQAKCINDWYFGHKVIRHNTIRKTLSDYADYHPTGIIIAVLEKACGEF